MFKGPWKSRPLFHKKKQQIFTSFQTLSSRTSSTQQRKKKRIVPSHINIYIALDKLERTSDYQIHRAANIYSETIRKFDYFMPNKTRGNCIKAGP